MGETTFEMVEVEGHSPVTEHLQGGWKATCPCGWKGELHEGDDAPAMGAANEDRFAHEDEIGARVEVELPADE